MKKQQEIKVIEANTPKLSPMGMEMFCRNLLKGVREYYKDPKNMEKFEKWKAEREKEQKATGVQA